MKRPTANDLKKEIQVLTSRSGGPGGQHVNKVETKVTLRWSVLDSSVLTELQKEMVKAALGSKITAEGLLIVSADSKRSQIKNKALAFKKLDRLIARSFTKKKKRIPTAPTKSSKRKRLENKKLHSEKKAMRKRVL